MLNLISNKNEMIELVKNALDAEIIYAVASASCLQIFTQANEVTSCTITLHQKHLNFDHFEYRVIVSSNFDVYANMPCQSYEESKEVINLINLAYKKYIRS